MVRFLFSLRYYFRILDCYNSFCKVTLSAGPSLGTLPMELKSEIMGLVQSSGVICALAWVSPEWMSLVARAPMVAHVSPYDDDACLEIALARRRGLYVRFDEDPHLRGNYLSSRDDISRRTRLIIEQSLFWVELNILPCAFEAYVGYEVPRVIDCPRLRRVSVVDCNRVCRTSRDGLRYLDRCELLGVIRPGTSLRTLSLGDIAFPSGVAVGYLVGRTALDAWVPLYCANVTTLDISLDGVSCLAEGVNSVIQKLPALQVIRLELCNEMSTAQYYDEPHLYRGFGFGDDRRGLGSFSPPPLLRDLSVRVDLSRFHYVDVQFIRWLVGGHTVITFTVTGTFSPSHVLLM